MGPIAALVAAAAFLPTDEARGRAVIEGERFPPSGRETMNRFFARFLRERRIEPLAIYGVHNEGAAPPERLTDALR
jgi:hypothetical protein